MSATDFVVAVEAVKSKFGCRFCIVQGPHCVYAIFDLKVESELILQIQHASSLPPANGKHLHGVQNISRLIDNYNMLEMRSTNTQKLCKSKTCKWEMHINI